MNAYRLIGDSLHFLSTLLLIVRIISSRSSHGVSGKSQVLYLLVFLTRYLDLVTNFVSLYNTVAKLFFILTSTTIVSLVYWGFPSRDSSQLDTLWVSPLLAVPALLALLVNNQFSAMEIMWTFSIYLEALVMLPQLRLSMKTKPEFAVLIYMAMMGSYRMFYCFNWIYRYNDEGNYDPIAIASGVVQTTIYTAFLVLNYDSIKRDMAMYRLIENDGETWTPKMENDPVSIQ